jgi:3-oxoacyl-[acyl-carrier-protein] synthase II
MSKRRVVLTGVGCLTPVGHNKEEFWASVTQGKSGVARITKFDPTHFSSHIAAEVKGFDAKEHFPVKEARKMDPFVQYAIVAAKEAFADSKIDLSTMDVKRFGVLIGSGIGGLTTIEESHKKYIAMGPEKGPGRISPFLIPMLLVNMASGQVSIYLGLKGPNTAVATACATGTHSIGDAFKLIQDGRADAMIAGGSEAAITPMGFGGFCALRALSTRNDEPEKACRPFDKNRDGFIMGEGAGVVVMEEMESAVKRGANIYCEIAGYAMTGDAHHMTAPAPGGEGGARAMKLCIEDAGVKPDDVTYINAHGTSTYYNDMLETAAIKTTFGEHAKNLLISSTKSVTGHLLGAAGGIEAIATAMALKNGLVPPTINYEEPDPDCDLYYVPNQAEKKDIKVAMSNSLGFGGHNATILLKKFDG